MNTTKHTPGPWEWRKDEQGRITHIVSLIQEPNQFAEDGWLNPSVLLIDEEWVRYEDVDTSIDIDDADAKLIAAAPDLLENAKAALAALEQHKTFPADVEAAKLYLRAAIAKATND
jgi:hypothetical protein